MSTAINILKIFFISENLNNDNNDEDDLKIENQDQFEIED